MTEALKETMTFILHNYMLFIAGLTILSLLRILLIGEKMESVIGKPINYNADISMIYPDGKGGHIRVFKNEQEEI